jgi:hypothetical protein
MKKMMPMIVRKLGVNTPAKVPIVPDLLLFFFTVEPDELLIYFLMYVLLQFLKADVYQVIMQIGKN